MTFPTSVLIREVGPREGFQTLKRDVSIQDKLRLVNALVNTGVPEIEVTSFVRPDRVPQMADASQLAESLASSKAKADSGSPD